MKAGSPAPVENRSPGTDRRCVGLSLEVGLGACGSAETELDPLINGVRGAFPPYGSAGAGLRLRVRCIVGFVGSWGVASFENRRARGMVPRRRGSARARSGYGLGDRSGTERRRVPWGRLVLRGDRGRRTLRILRLSASGSAARQRLQLRSGESSRPHADEIELVVQAISRVREESELRELWEVAGDRAQWLAEVDDLLSRLGRSSAGSPPSVSP